MQRENAVFVDWLNLILGVLLLISPWVLNFPAGTATANAIVFGLVIAAVAIAALAAFARWEEWVNLIVGLWVVISPFALGFSSSGAAVWTHVVIGAVVAALAAIELLILSGNRPPQQVAR